jgi:membrane protein implicated in regulation of membrane protease activity
VVGTPLAYGLALLMLLVVVFTEEWGGSLVTLAHEGGHYAVAIVTGYRPNRYELGEGSQRGTTGYEADWWSPLRILRVFAGHATPPLLGLGGATLIAHGRAWSALILALVLLAASFLIATNALAITVAALAVLGIGTAVLLGGPQLQVAVAVALVWLLLIGGLYSAIFIPRDSDSSDIAKLQRDSLIVPRIVWQASFVLLGLFCLYQGGRLLLRG